MTTLLQFFHDRPAINVTKFAKEADVDRFTLMEFINGKRNPMRRTLERIEKVAVKYGYHK